MHKVLPTLLALLIFTFSYSQKNRSDIKGITVRGIKGVKKSVGTIIINSNKNQIPSNYRVKLRPELEGPIPKGQNPNARPLNKFGTKINGKDHLNSLNAA